MFRRIYFILVFFPTFTRCYCPPNYVRFSEDVCMIQLNETTEFCEASSFCSNYGKKHNQLVFLHGRNVNFLKPILPHRPWAWNGMHVLLGIPESHSVAGWHDMDPRSPEFTSGPDSFKWGENQPNGNEPHLIYHKKDDAMYDVYSRPYDFAHAVHCEYGGELPKDNLNVLFKADFPKKFNNIVQPRPDFLGCPLTLEAATKMDCARRCALDPACRSIYFNNKEKKCIHMLYADSLLPQTITTSPEGWSRFAKTARGIP
ncbi:PAN domain protein [Opisthorchis viverrini]|uniref:PAN domain protein n=1 Tax=Opisthorchis viverrini TaxID=6198 RepID=A0A1S8WUG3_OPIVI|nr:PAN domain protein [Opisthorchis viverrini]